MDSKVSSDHPKHDQTFFSWVLASHCTMWESILSFYFYSLSNTMGFEWQSGAYSISKKTLTSSVFLYYIIAFALFVHRPALLRIPALLGPFCHRIRDGVRLKKHRNGRELSQLILYNKIHSTVVLISSSNTSQHWTLMRESFQLDTVWHWPCFSVTFNCQQ